MDTATKGNIPVTTSKKAVAKSNWPVLQHPIAEMERAFDRFFGSHSWPSLRRWEDVPAFDNLFEFQGLRVPSLDVVDRDNEVLIRAELPGIDKKDINVSLSDNLLTIKGESSKGEKKEKGDYYRNEISSSSFARTVTVPSDIDISKTVANLKDGVLEIKLPKAATSKKHNISVM
jgi:HSP20 family protein